MGKSTFGALDGVLCREVPGSLYGVLHWECPLVEVPLYILSRDYHLGMIEHCTCYYTTSGCEPNYIMYVVITKPQVYSQQTFRDC